MRPDKMARFETMRRRPVLLEEATSTSAIEGLTYSVPDAAADAMSWRLRSAQLPRPDATPRELAAIKQEIARDLAPFDALHILATLMVTRMTDDLSGDFEPAGTMEYVATVLLERPDQGATAAPVGEVEKNAAVQRTLDRVRGLTLYGLRHGRITAATARAPIEAIATALRSSDALVRGHAHEPQVVTFLRAILDTPSFADFFDRAVGFDACQALECDRAIRDLLVARITEWRDHVPRAIEAAETLWNSGERPVPPGLELRLGRSREQRFWWLVAQYFTSDAIVDLLSVSADELAEAAGVSVRVAHAFLDRFTSSWGTSRGLTLLSGRNEVRHRPLLRGRAGRAHPTAHENLLWAIRPALEEALKADRSMFEEYQVRRAAHTEEETARLFGLALRPDLLLTNLNFSIPHGNGEVDVLIRIDDLLIIVEAKSGVLSDAAYAGRKAALRRDLQKLLGKSSTQTSRLDSALRNGEPVTFSNRATGEPVDVDLSSVQRFHGVVVTLEDLTPVVMRPDWLAGAGIVDPERAFPWCVSLFDLETIAKSTQFPAQLTGYLSARAEIDPRAEWPAEDDLWMTHLLSRLDFSHVDEQPFMVDGRTDLLADQWMRDRPAPRADLSKATKKALQRLGQRRPEGWLRETERLLDDARRGRRAKVVTPVRPDA